jgi:MFS superfamily sulfate permease-like transporter
MMGVQVEAEGFFRELLGTIQAIPETNWYALALGLGSIVIIRLLKRYAPKLPGALVALVVMTLAVSFFNLTEYGVAVLGEIPSGPPHLTVPRASFREWVLLIPGALAIVALTLAEGLLLARSYAQKYGYRIDPDQEEFAYGAGNVAAAFTGAMAMGSSASRTAAIDDTGAKTQWPSIVSAGIVALVLLFFTDQLALLPSAVLAGIVANSVLKLIDIQAFRELYRLRASEFAIAVVCTLGLLVLGTIPGLAVAFLLTTIEMVRRAARPRTAVLEPRADGLGYESLAVGDHSVVAAGIVIYRFGGPIFFANAGLLESDVAHIVATAKGKLHAFILDAEAINDIDTTGVETLEGIITLLRSNNIALAVSRAKQPVPDLLRHYGLLDEIGEEKLFETNREALVAMQLEQGEPQQLG